MNRRGRTLRKLQNCPLVLVLAQVRFSPIMGMSAALPAIQDRLRRLGYKVNVSGHVQEISMSAQGPRSGIVQPHWEFQNQGRTASVVVNDGFAAYQTTAYETFDKFFEETQAAVDVIAELVEGLLIQRVGLRYVDLIRPRPGESWTDYLRDGLHGLSTPAFLPDTVEHIHQTVGKTTAGTMVVRVLQNRTGSALPADLTIHNLALPPHARDLGSTLTTVVDMDHYRDDLSDDYSRDGLNELGWQLKNTLYETFVERVVTEHAMQVWE